ncbi:Pimeloyl-ACP methyl ester carboxylesterase [Micromonospora rhizosphaerae]|uniref:Pimeloyl-ACP methyl ester carboxylesterase n=1 Tax=Micromonospora rhizosphaerae TaxID=568872 RepID=A0A1C6T4M6_9ACTN|nr:alpha/beta fold hydrolase [Micromonospora rhizosphaerae]SCL36522.1 Pimeloyl-ACP methyl ester carboxylesterase [Micromonospora rhizosphaerae]
MTVVHYRHATVQGQRLFYREAGPADGPAIVLLHGFPTSSFMFRNLIPALADRYRVIAPDHLGFGLSAAPSVEEFDYTFDALADLTAGLLDRVGVGRYAMYVQDYGAPIGWRLALANPAAITAIITQNGNGYDAGFVAGFWQTVWDYQREQTPETEANIRTALTLEAALDGPHAPPPGRAPAAAAVALRPSHLMPSGWRGKRGAWRAAVERQAVDRWVCGPAAGRAARPQARGAERVTAGRGGDAARSVRGRPSKVKGASRRCATALRAALDPGASATPRAGSRRQARGLPGVHAPQRHHGLVA